jgi:hypothetical protein
MAGKSKEITYVVDSNNCHNCTSHSVSNRYPQIKRDGKYRRVHAYIYEQCFGEIPDGKVVRHKCDNTMCINPEHLELGTHADNMSDMKRRNRSASGERNGSNKLSNEQVVEIRDMLASGNSQQSIADKFKVSQMTISLIKNNKVW